MVSDTGKYYEVITDNGKKYLYVKDTGDLTLSDYLASIEKVSEELSLITN